MAGVVVSEAVAAGSEDLAEAVPAAAAPAEAGSLRNSQRRDRRKAGGFRMVAEKKIDEFVNRIKQAAGENLQSVILYGSAATGEFQADFSNVNLLCILRESSFSSLSAIAPVVEWWHRQKHPAPLVMTREELEHSTDVFSIELLDMQNH